MIDACNRQDIDAALSFMHEDIVYQNVPQEAARGLDAARQQLGPFLAMAEQVEWITHKSTSNGVDLVMNERSDRFLLAQGWVDFPVMGVFELRDGKIIAWRDYFDSALVQAQLGG